jgi:hypothetical protein
VKNLNSTTRMVAKAVLFTALMLAAMPAQAQLPRDPVERAKVVAQIFELNASQLTLFDREGKEVTKIGPRGMYDRPVLSPDGKRIVVIKGDLDKETRDIRVLDVATGRQGNVLHDPGLRGHGGGRHDDADVPGWHAEAAVQAAGSDARCSAGQDRQPGWAAVHRRHAGHSYSYTLTFDAPERVAAFATLPALDIAGANGLIPPPAI